MNKHFTLKNALKNVLTVLLILITAFLTVISNGAFFSYSKAITTTTSFDKSNVLTDLESSAEFNLENYPYDTSGNLKSPGVINFVEWCYSPFKKGDFALYLYFYNPQALNISTTSTSNRVQMAVAYKTNSTQENLDTVITSDSIPVDYETFNVVFCNKSERAGTEGLFYKFKVVDHKSAYGFNIEERVNPNLRRYDVSGLTLATDTGTKEFTVGGTYKFSGYAKGYGADANAESTLKNEGFKELETVSLEVHKTHFRTGEYKKNYKHDLTSVYFSVPDRFFDVYGSLQKIKAEWYEYITTPIAITSNATVYNGLKAQIGIDVTKDSMPLSLYSGYQQLWHNYTGHYNKYDFGYNVTGEIDTQLNILNYVFSTNGENISEYVLSANRLQTYIEGYNKSYTNGKVEIPGKSLSADLFESDLSEDRKTVSYVDNDIHHKLINFDAGDTFNMLNYNDTTTGAYRFFASLFGLAPSELDQSYNNISPIHIVTDEERNDSDISQTLLIDNNDQKLNEFKDFYDKEKSNGKKTVLFRFAQTDYLTIPVIAYNEETGTNLSGNYGKDTYIVQESIFLNFDIIELTFAKDGEYIVIPAVSSPIDIYNDIEIPANTTFLDTLFSWLNGVKNKVLTVLITVAIVFAGTLLLLVLFKLLSLTSDIKTKWLRITLQVLLFLVVIAISAYMVLNVVWLFT